MSIRIEKQLEQTTLNINEHEFFINVHEMTAIISRALHYFIGDLGGFKIQLEKDESLSNLPSRYYLHSVQSKSKLLEDVLEKLRDVWVMVSTCHEPKKIKTQWLKSISISQEVLTILSKRRVYSNREDYIVEVENTIDILNSLGKLNESFRKSIEVFYLDSDQNKINSSINDLTKVYADTLEVIKKLKYHSR